MPERAGEEVHRAIERILARPAFAPEPRSWAERARDLVAERLAELFDALGSGEAGAAVAWTIVVAVMAITVFLAVRFSRGVRADPVLVGATGGQGPRPATDWRAEAVAHEAAGRWRAALRCRWRALVADLAGRGLLEEAPGRTAGEYRRQLASSMPVAAPDFDAATALFEAVWYGGRPADAGQAERLQVHSTRVLEGVTSRP